jgi:hypothetical protein
MVGERGISCHRMDALNRQRTGRAPPRFAGERGFCGHSFLHFPCPQNEGTGVRGFGQALQDFRGLSRDRNPPQASKGARQDGTVSKSLLFVVVFETCEINLCDGFCFAGLGIDRGSLMGIAGDGYQFSSGKRSPQRFSMLAKGSNPMPGGRAIGISFS